MMQSTIKAMAGLLRLAAVALCVHAIAKTQAAAPAWPPSGYAPTSTVSLNKVFETSVSNTKFYANKFKDVTLNVTYTHNNSGKTVAFWGFYDGDGNGGQGNTWKMRFMPDLIGEWSYTWSWTDGTPGGSGSFACVAANAGKGVLKAYQNNTNWFAYNGTEPVWLKSYYIIDGGILLDDASWFANNVYQKIVDRGYNHIQLNGLPVSYTYQHFSDGPNNGDGFMYSGTNPSVSMDLTICKSIDEHMRWLNDRDIAVHFFQGFDGKEDYARNAPRYAEMSSEERDFLVRYVCARLAPFANITGWCYTWETWDSPNERDLMDRLEAHDPWGHLKAYMQGLYPGDAGNAGWWNYPGYTFVATEYVGSGASPDPNNRNGSQQQPGYVNAKIKELADYYDKPIFHSECWGMWRSCYGASQTSIRKTGWANALAGATATWNDLESCDGGNASTDIFAWAEAAKAMDVLAGVMREDVVFHRMYPNNGIVGNGAFALAEEGSQYLVFKESGGSFDLAMPAETYGGSWVDTKNGNKVNIPAFGHGGGKRGFTAPNSGTDWVLVLKSGQSAALSACFNPSATTGQAPFTVSFDAGCSSPAKGKTITAYQWSFGDGKSGSGQTISHTFAQPGTYTVTLTVADGTGTDQTTKAITATPKGGAGTGLKASYFAGRGFGDLLISRIDPSVDFDWGDGTPAAGVPSDNYSVRWEGEVVPLYQESYTFETETDDGVRLWVDGQLLIDQWVDQGPTKTTGNITLMGGQAYAIKMEYYENGGGAMAKLRWRSDRQPYQIVPTSQLFPKGGGGGSGGNGNFKSSDIGNPCADGSFAMSGNEATLVAGGSDIWGVNDQFHFAYQPLQGNGQITAMVTGMTNTYEWAKAGLMVRSGLQPDAAHAFIAITPENGVAFQRRLGDGYGSTHNGGSGNGAPRWLRLTREGNLVTGYESADGSNWAQAGQATIDLPPTAYIGLAATAHNDCNPTTVNYTNIAIVGNNTGAPRLAHLPKPLHEQKPWIKAYPVPARQTLNIEVGGGGTAPASVWLTDISGRTIATAQAELSGGKQVARFDTRQLAQGLYLVQTNISGTVVTHKVWVGF